MLGVSHQMCSNNFGSSGNCVGTSVWNGYSSGESFWRLCPRGEAALECEELRFRFVLAAACRRGPESPTKQLDKKAERKLPERQKRQLRYRSPKRLRREED